MKFNLGIKARSTVTNHQGAKAFKMTPELELYSAVATTMLSDVTYEGADERLTRILSLMSRVNPAFAARLAVYARTEMNLRSAPVVLSTALASMHHGDDLVSRTIQQVVQRPDEIMEVLAYYQVHNKRAGVKKLHRLSKQVQKGLAATFNRFDEYQFAKYDRQTEIRLRDALFLVHPKAKDENQQLLFNKIANQQLSTPYTWETELSALGQKKFADEAEKKAAVKAKWEELIDSRKLGYMALLRNLRNILEARVSPTHIKKIGGYLSDEQAVKQSKQLPFRFLAAYRELTAIQSGYTGYFMDVLETALKKSISNMPGFDFDERVVIACDVSGSMQKPVSEKSKILFYDIGLLMGMLLQSKCSHVLTGMFGDTWKTVSLPTQSTLSNVDAFYKREGEVGYATNGYLVIKDLIDRGHIADKVMLFTDMQLWDNRAGNANEQNTLLSQWKAYKKISPTAKLYLWDLVGYGQAPLTPTDDDVYLIAGWSDKIFAVLKALEDGANTLSMIDEITV